MSDSLGQSDSGKEYVLTGKNGQVNSFNIPDLQYTTFGKFIIYRLLNDRDVKILITGKGKTTGTGKTTLGILIARWINHVRNDLFNMDQNWHSSEYSFMDVWEYLQKYKESLPGDPLLTDELEYMADRRRHMSNENVKFSQAWSILRYKNVVTIGTAPGLSDLEKRVIETADIWINVVHTGRANTYYLTFDDFEWKPIYKRLRVGPYRESLVWDKCEDSNYKWLKNQKKELGVPGIDDQKGQQLEQSDLNKMERELKNDATKETLKLIYEKELEKTISQGEISDIIGVSQQQVSKLKRELEQEGELPV